MSETKTPQRPVIDMPTDFVKAIDAVSWWWRGWRLASEGRSKGELFLIAPKKLPDECPEFHAGYEAGRVAVQNAVAAACAGRSEEFASMMRDRLAHDGPWSWRGSGEKPVEVVN